jgi:hypothetical protein
MVARHGTAAMLIPAKLWLIGALFFDCISGRDLEEGAVGLVAAEVGEFLGTQTSTRVINRAQDDEFQVW